MEQSKKKPRIAKECRHRWTMTNTEPDEEGRQLCRCEKCGELARLRYPVHNCHNYR